MIHWVSCEEAHQVDFFVYDLLFTEKEPGKYIDNVESIIDQNSKQCFFGVVESSVFHELKHASFQLERIGYFKWDESQKALHQNYFVERYLSGERNMLTESLIAEMLDHMLKLQDEHNQKIHINWREQQYPFYRAIWLESAELLEHYGWKWWSQKPRDLEQVYLEIVDIWHFGLSQLLMEEKSSDEILESILSVSSKNVSLEDVAFSKLLEAFVSHTLNSASFSVERFLTMSYQISFSFEDIYKYYISKNILNNFRQDHGYKDGSYRKSWMGREDNEHLIEIIRDKSVLRELELDRLENSIYSDLKVLYAKALTEEA